MMVMHGRLAEGGRGCSWSICTIADNLISSCTSVLLALYQVRPRNPTFGQDQLFWDGLTAHGSCNAMGSFGKERGGTAAMSDGALQVDRFKRFPTPLVRGSVRAIRYRS